MPGPLIDEQTTQQEQAQALVKKLSKWTIGVALATLVLLAISTLLVLFVPPVAAVILPLFAAIGSWSPLLILTAFLPSVGLGIGSLVALHNSKELQTRIDISDNEFLENPETRLHHASTESLANQASSTLPDDEKVVVTTVINKSTPKSRRSSFLLSAPNGKGTKKAENQEVDQTHSSARNHSL
jgi:hypothetical protein